MTTVIGVSFKRAGKMYYFDPNGLELHIGDKAIVETARGMECGDVVTEVKEVADDEVVQPLKTVIRAATEEDCAQHPQGGRGFCHRSGAHCPSSAGNEAGGCGIYL